MTMFSILYVTLFGFIAVNCQSNAYNRQIIPRVLDCYNNSYLLTRDNRLPHNMITLIEILRKIEDSPGSPMRTLSSLSTALLHGFRQDGIQRSETLITSKEIIPYAATNIYKFNRFVKLLRAVPGDSMTFPNESISDIEKCTLHFMLSNTIEEEKRDREDCNRNFDNAYRYPRSVNTKPLLSEGAGVNDDVEMLSPHEIQTMTINKQKDDDSDVDPNSFYSEFPPNHPAVAQLMKEEKSACPVASGLVKTNWGEVSVGPIIAGIAAAKQPQLIRINELMRGENVEPGYFENSPELNNKWFATITNDLAAVCWRQGPNQENSPFEIGLDGKWNSSELPRWFFLNTDKYLQLTKPQLRGDIDGLIIANTISSIGTNSFQNIRLSQVLDMYYSPRGLLNPEIRACNRKELFARNTPIDSFEQQTYSAVKTLRDLAGDTIPDNKLQQYSKKAVRQVVADFANLMRDDLTCAETDRKYNNRGTFVDLTVILDNNWPFKNIQPILAKLLESIEVTKYNCNFTLINGENGHVMMNSTNTILDFYNFTASDYAKYPRGFNMLQSILIMKERLEEKLDREQSQGKGGGHMDVILFIPYLNSNAENDRDQCVDKIRNMYEEIPDISILILTPSRKENWVHYVETHEDVFLTGTSHSSSSIQTLINSMTSRFKQYPKRLINSQCGSKYESRGSSQAYSDSVEPRGIKYYRIHPNYFYTSDGNAKVNIQSSETHLTICTSRELMLPNKKEPDSCQSLNSNSQFTLNLQCGDASYIHHCKPYYISVSSNSSTSTSASYRCTNCRYPDETSYKFSYENLGCTSDARSITISRVTLILSIVMLFKLMNF